jgi:hypothetical protein
MIKRGRPPKKVIEQTKPQQGSPKQQLQQPVGKTCVNCIRGATIKRDSKISFACGQRKKTDDWCADFIEVGKEEIKENIASATEN